MNITQRISAEAVEEFKAIYRKEFGGHLSDDEAREMGLSLLGLLKVLLESSTRASANLPGLE